MTLQEELDKAHQELFNCKRKLKTLEALQVDYVEQISLLEKELSDAKHENKIKHLEKNIEDLKVSYGDKIQSLEAELTIKKFEIANLKKVDVTNLVEESFSSEQLVTEIENLKEDNSKLQSRLEELEYLCEHYNNKITSIEEHRKKSESELTEALDSVRAELRESKDLITTLKDENHCLQNELDSLKNKPLDPNSRGNSVFAEVNDRRVVLEERMKIMKEKFLKLKQERDTYRKENETLRREKASLIACWRKRLEEKDMEEMHERTLEIEINNLKELIQSYKRELEKQPKIPEDGTHVEIIKYYNMLTSFKQKEIETLRYQLSHLSTNHTSLSYDFTQEHRKLLLSDLQVEDLRNQLSEHENEINKLKAQLENLQVSPKEQPVEEAALKSIVKKEEPCETEKVVDLTCNKENCGEAGNQRVRFAENTVEPTTSNCIQMRRKAKIIISKSVHFPSIPKKES